MITSGIRIGTPAMTTRGFGEAQARQVAAWIAGALEARDDERRLANIAGRVKALCAEFTVYLPSTAA